MKHHVQGARFENLYEILKNFPNPIEKVRHLIFGSGISNRAQSANATANNYIGNLYFQASKHKFSNAKIY